MINGGSSGVTPSRSGPTLAGLDISDSTASATAHDYLFGPRTDAGVAFPVPTLQPKAATTQIALDLAPSSAGINGDQCWIDLCDRPIIDTAATGAVAATRLGMNSNCGYVATQAFNGATLLPLFLSAGLPSPPTGGTVPQINLGTNQTIIIGEEGSDLIVGTGAAKGTADTAGWFYVSFTNGAPTGVPRWSANGAAMAYDKTNHKLWVYDGTWKGVALA